MRIMSLVICVFGGDESTVATGQPYTFRRIITRQIMTIDTLQGFYCINCNNGGIKYCS